LAQLQITGGELRGRRLSFLPEISRPTSSMAREALFNILTHQYSENLKGAILDPFGGSGALSFEALSRGAESAYICESHPQAARELRKNIAKLALESKIFFSSNDALNEKKLFQFLGTTKFSLVFLDPPYESRALHKFLLFLKRKRENFDQDTLFVLEHNTQFKTGSFPKLNCLDQRIYGEVHFSICQLASQEPGV